MILHTSEWGPVLGAVRGRRQVEEEDEVRTLIKVSTAVQDGYCVCVNEREIYIER